jgi:methyl-accepting chemotaxis protein
MILRKFTVAQKMYTGFFSILIFMGILGGLSSWNMKNLNEKSTEIADSWLPGVESINNINYLTEHILTLEYQFVLKSDNSQLTQLEKEMEQTFSQISQTFDVYERTIFLEEDRKNFDSLKDKWNEYKNIHSAFVEVGREINLTKEVNSAKAEQLLEVISESQRAFGEMQVYVDALVKLNHDGAEQASLEANNLFANGRSQNMTLLIFAVILGMSIAFVTARSITKPLGMLTANVKEVAQGNLTVDPVVIKNKDEMGELAQSFNEMMSHLSHLIRQVSQSSDAVAASSEELLASSEQTSKATEQITIAMQEIAAGSDKQVNSTTQVNETVSEIAKGMEEVAKSIQTVADVSMITNQKAENGNQIAAETMQQMNMVYENVSKTATIINRLGKRSEEIGKIVDLISQVSDQTNLLALNAAIEAARAGEHGRGFAVVADEVRKLAEEARKATSSIHQLIEKIQDEIHEVVESMEEGTTSVKIGMERVDETGNEFKEIVKMIANITSQTQEVSAIVEEVNSSTEEMVHTFTEMASVSAQSAASTEQVASSAEEQNASMEEIASSANSLSSMALELQQATSKFKV